MCHAAELLKHSETPMPSMTEEPLRSISKAREASCGQAGGRQQGGQVQWGGSRIVQSEGRADIARDFHFRVALTDSAADTPSVSFARSTFASSMACSISRPRMTFCKEVIRSRN